MEDDGQRNRGQPENPRASPPSFLAAFGHLRDTAGYVTTAPLSAPARVTDSRSVNDEERSAPVPAPEPVAPERDRCNAQHQHISSALAHARSKTIMLAHSRQRGNPMLKHVRHVRVGFDGDIVADFVCGATTGVLYLSLQYHNLNPGYVYERVKMLGRAYRLRVLLVLADIEETGKPIAELSKLSMLAGLTLVCAGSEREAARYCETLRSYDGKTADGIRERVGADYASRLGATLSSVRGVNKTDVTTLAFRFGPIKSLAEASMEEVRQCAGMGERKVARLHAALHQPFRTDIEWRPPGGNIPGDDDGYS
jgi:DNA excision repair protein ERCC-1